MTRKRTQFFLRSYPEPDAMAEHAAAVEADGWDGLLFQDSQNLTMDVVASLHLAAAATSQLVVGTAVSNLTSRHPAVVAATYATLHHVSDGRAHLGVGRGDTALELLGVKPPTAAEFAQQLRAVQTYLRGEVLDVQGFGSRITWLPLVGETKVPVDVFASGPRMIDLAARDADRVTVTVGAEAERVGWGVRAAREAGAQAVGAFVVVGVGTDEYALEELVRGNASISAHFQRNVVRELSVADAHAVEAVTQRYDFYHHGLEHAEQSSGLDADFLRRFCVLGPPDHCIERLHALLDIGLDHLVVVGGSRDIDPAVRRRSDHLISTDVLPALREHAR